MSNISKVPVIKVENINKSFGSIHVLRGVNLEVYPGEAVALVGDNGSGKSTLIKILSGTYGPDKGSIYIHNKQIEHLTPKKALAEGIATVYQDLSLDNYRDVTGNIFLGQEITKWGFFLDYPAMEAIAIDLLKKLKINIPDPRVPVGYLSGGQRQGVAIARAVFQGKEIMIFDEPTAAMGVKETATTLKLIHSLTEQGIAVIIVSHNLFQVFDIAHRVCIMKHGRIVKEIPTGDSSPQEVHQSLIGQTGLEDRMEQIYGI